MPYQPKPKQRRPCKVCGKKVWLRSPLHCYCSDACRTEHYRDYQRAYAKAQYAETKAKQRDYQRKYQQQRFADPEAREKRREYNRLYAKKRRVKLRAAKA